MKALTYKFWSITSATQFSNSHWLEHIERSNNCACPTKTIEWLWQQATPSTSRWVLPELYSERLPNGDYWCFNPKSSKGVVVLNTTSWELLQGFKSGNTLDTAASQDTIEAVQHLINLELLTPEGTTPKLLKQQPETLTAWVHTTNDCNLRCPYCFVAKTPDPMESEIGRAGIDAIFRSAQLQGFRKIHLKYAGGEATLNIQLVFDLHQYALQQGDLLEIEVDGVVLSNGVGIPDWLIQGLKTHQLNLMISLDGVGKWHDQQRPTITGRGSFEHIVKTLDRLKRHALLPSISVTITQYNLLGLRDTLTFLLNRELPFSLNFYRETDCSAAFTDLVYQETQMIESLRNVFALLETRLPPYTLLSALTDLARLDTPHERPCGVGDSYLVVSQKGEIAKCHMHLDRPITDVSAPDPLHLIRLDQIGVQNPSVDHKAGCRDCTWRYHCAGGCPALTFRVTGRYDVQSPNCRIYKAIFPAVLRLEALRLQFYTSPIGW